ncbi:glutamine amidotransferase [Legionella sainthelensi]|uniref:Glutamine amidotransferase n=2 Tax=Legionella sainthelensi TaxID=28087 RepID=A0A0W0YC48_9GAMM|nr:gamma-glutamyl-gamma-aminobutyrate hydrolase family protein [Legionella sainthelensi]KTD54115.1 glutamine amidotransferase [Legionella sainthelensi]
MKEKFNSCEQVNVGISYNKINGGAAADSIRHIILEQNLNLIETDYRSIIPPHINLDGIFENQDKFLEILNHAKTQATLLLKDLDGLIIPGSDARIDPRLYREPLTEHPDRIDLARSIAELALVHVAMQHGIPILGICGGHQIINVYLGGTLKALSEEDIDAQGYMCYSLIGFNPKTELAKIFFEIRENRDNLRQTEIYSHQFFGAHKHAIKQLAHKELANKDQMISVVAIADDSNYTIEGFESKYGSPLYSMQFHPEVGAKGMYSQLYKTISYQAATSEDIMTNSKIFMAFKQAMITFHLKKSLFKSIRNKEEVLELKGYSESVSPEKKIESSKTTSALDLYTLFKDTQSQVDNHHTNEPEKSLIKTGF